MTTQLLMYSLHRISVEPDAIATKVSFTPTAAAPHRFDTTPVNAQ
ncbi:hypothetical protein [Halioxenophilus aromaticivorans]